VDRVIRAGLHPGRPGWAGSTPSIQPSLASAWRMPAYPMDKKRKDTLPACGLALAILTHSLHNTIAELFDQHATWLVGTMFDWSGWLLMFIFPLDDPPRTPVPGASSG
jgi:hypothetical protein